MPGILRQWLNLYQSILMIEMVAYAPWKPFADADYPNMISLWTRITGIPFEYQVKEVYRAIAEAIGTVLKIEEQKGKALIELPCTKPLIFSSVLEFEEGQQSRIMFDYQRLSGFCNLCYPMTHDERACYKAKKLNADTGTMETRKNVSEGRVKSFKGAVQGGNRSKAAPNMGKAMAGTSKGPLKPHGIKRHTRGLFRGNGTQAGEQLVGASSSKKDNVTKDGPDSIIAESDDDLLSEEEKEPIAKDNETAVIDSIALEAAVKQSQTLPAAEMKEFHESVVKRLEECRQARFAKPPPGPSKPPFRPSTPLRGMSMKKMAMVAAFTPIKATKKGETKKGTHKERD